MDRARQAVNVATMNLRVKEDEVALFTFDSKLREVMAFTSDLNRVNALEPRRHAVGRHVALRRHRADRAQGSASAPTITARARHQRRRGHGEHARRLPQVSGIASSIDVPVYLLTVVNPLDHPGGEFEVLQAADRKAGSASLADLARWTGGDIRFASVPSAHVGGRARPPLRAAASALITFEPGARAGWHPIEIRTRKKNLVVHARSGYLTGPSQTGT